MNNVNLSGIPNSISPIHGVKSHNHKVLDAKIHEARSSLNLAAESMNLSMQPELG